jgi:hypothetical protein
VEREGSAANDKIAASADPVNRPRDHARRPLVRQRKQRSRLKGSLRRPRYRRVGAVAAAVGANAVRRAHRAHHAPARKRWSLLPRCPVPQSSRLKRSRRWRL